MNPKPQAKISENENILILESWIEHYRQALSRISKEDATTHHVSYITKIAERALETSTADLYFKRIDGEQNEN